MTELQRKFVLHWGEMGAHWGVNRTVVQNHALLFIHGRALHAEALAETLNAARSNISTSLKELQAWGLVRMAHVLGDRRDCFETSADKSVNSTPRPACCVNWWPAPISPANRPTPVC